MGRPRKQQREPFWFAARNAWYVDVAGRKVRLSPDKDEAWRAWHELMARPEAEREAEAARPSAPASLAALFDAFLLWAKSNRAPRTFDAYFALLQLLIDAVPPGLPAADLKPYHLTAVMDARGWSNNTKHDFVTTVKRALNWAVDEGYMDRSPVDRMKKPAREARELAASPADFAEVVAAIREPRFRELVELAWETGARPQELRIIEARHYDAENARIVLPPKEAKGKKHHRIIYLGSEKAREVVARLAATHPAGPLLRNSEGRPWTKDAINCAFARLGERMGRRLHLGAFRKGFATEALKAGVDVIGLSHLMGHRDGTMLARVYAKPHQDPEYMAGLAGRAKRPKS